MRFWVVVFFFPFSLAKHLLVIWLNLNKNMKKCLKKKVAHVLFNKDIYEKN